VDDPMLTEFQASGVSCSSITAEDGFLNDIIHWYEELVRNNGDAMTLAVVHGSRHEPLPGGPND
jgi:hypothetical protein